MKLRIAFVTGVLAAAIAVAPVGSSQPPQNRQATFGNLIAALNNLNVQIRKLNVLSNLTAGEIRIVNVDNLLSGNKIRVLNRALNRNRVKVLSLRNVLNNNSCSLVAVCNSLNNVLQNANIAITDVIAINVLSGGDVVVFRDGPGAPALP
jgi:hypothetical protein